MKLSPALCTSILTVGLNPAAEAQQEHMGSGHLRVELEGDEIVVRKPGTSLLLAYSKSVEQPRLVLTRSWMKPPAPSPAVGEFRAEAFQAAVSKACELGWFVVAKDPPVWDCPKADVQNLPTDVAE
jgi:hypothetical protein